MSNGGYQILDLKNAALTSGTKKTIKGTFDALDRANKKRVVISGMNVGGTAYNDIEGYFIPSVNVSTNRATGYNGTLTIGASSVAVNVANDDGVTVTVTTNNRSKK